ncbi:MAG: molybdopterin-dependent oxidoreductase [Phyllobacteriaceae bacterium]|nr:molybdopterin-dependent oxidoreductase [Phyllobacteriaceae bacterium]
MQDVARETHLDAGLDLFWKPNGRFQLSATLNPDFGQVESDAIVVNFGAIETFFGDKAATDAAFAKAPHVVKHRFVINRVTAASMEPRGSIGVYRPYDDHYTIYTTLQDYMRRRQRAGGLPGTPEHSDAHAAAHAVLFCSWAGDLRAPAAPVRTSRRRRGGPHAPARIRTPSLAQGRGWPPRRRRNRGRISCRRACAPRC